MRLFHFERAKTTEMSQLPSSLPSEGYCWLAFSRREFEIFQGELQRLLMQHDKTQVHELHWQDLLNNQLPSHHDASFGYDVMVFRRLAPGRSEKDLSSPGSILHHSRGLAGPEILSRIDTSPIGALLCRNVVISVHPADCVVRDQFIVKMTAASQLQSTATSARVPSNPAELMLRLLSSVVDGYLDLRRELTRQLDQWQKHLLHPDNRFNNWVGLLDSRMTLHHLDEICEDQRAALQGWIQSLDAWLPGDRLPKHEIEHLKVRSRDLLEHVERVIHHVNRLEQSTETTMQLHFNVQGNRTNDIMRTLTVLTAIFLPLNLITGFFGMNFESFDFIHRTDGLMLTELLMLAVAVILILVFWRKRYLGIR